MVVPKTRNSAKRTSHTYNTARTVNFMQKKNHKHVKKVENRNQLSAPSTSAVDKDAETVLLLEWDIERFFSNSRAKKTKSDAISSPALPQSRPEQATATTATANSPKQNAHAIDANKKTECQPVAKNKLVSGAEHRRNENVSSAQPSGSKSSHEVKQPKNSFLSNFIENAKMHRRQESDSKLSLNFVRGFRRENSDFFPLSKRHSAILGERQVAAVAGNIASHRSSAIYTKNSKNNNGEPILTDFVSRQYLENPSSTATTTTTSSSASIKNPNSTSDRASANHNSFFMGPRRQKTESVILLRNSTNKNLLFDMQQVKIKSSKSKPKKKNQKRKRNI